MFSSRQYSAAAAAAAAAATVTGTAASVSASASASDFSSFSLADLLCCWSRLFDSRSEAAALHQIELQNHTQRQQQLWQKQLRMIPIDESALAEFALFTESAVEAAADAASVAFVSASASAQCSYEWFCLRAAKLIRAITRKVAETDEQAEFSQTSDSDRESAAAAKDYCLRFCAAAGWPINEFPVSVSIKFIPRVLFSLFSAREGKFVADLISMIASGQQFSSGAIRALSIFTQFPPFYITIAADSQSRPAVKSANESDSSASAASSAASDLIPLLSGLILFSSPQQLCSLRLLNEIADFTSISLANFKVRKFSPSLAVSVLSRVASALCICLPSLIKLIKKNKNSIMENNSELNYSGVLFVEAMKIIGNIKENTETAEFEQCHGQGRDQDQWPTSQFRSFHHYVSVLDFTFPSFVGSSREYFSLNFPQSNFTVFNQQRIGRLIKRIQPTRCAKQLV